MITTHINNIDYVWEIISVILIKHGNLLNIHAYFNFPSLLIELSGIRTTMHRMYYINMLKI